MSRRDSAEFDALLREAAEREAAAAPPLSDRQRVILRAHLARTPEYRQAGRAAA